MTFNDILGLDETKETLLRSVKKSHIAHAQLFHGKEGAPTLAMALAYVAYINCEDKQENDSCGKCASCYKLKKLSHPDLFLVFPTGGGEKVNADNTLPQYRKFVDANPYGSVSDWLAQIDAKQGNISVSEARNLIQKLTLKPYEAEFKIVIIWLPEFMAAPAANALLKVIEEPPSKTLFFLVSNDEASLIPTIISRTQQVYIRQHSDNEIINLLLKRGLNHEKAKGVAYLTAQNFTKALEIIDDEGEHQTEWFANWMRLCYKSDLIKLVALADEFDGFTKEKQKETMLFGLEIFRDLFLVKLNVETLIRLEGADLQFVENFAKAMNFTHFEAIIQLLSDTHYQIDRNGRAKIIFLDISLKICDLIR